jgi:hypothetical protein
VDADNLETYHAPSFSELIIKEKIKPWYPKLKYHLNARLSLLLMQMHCINASLNYYVNQMITLTFVNNMLIVIEKMMRKTPKTTRGSICMSYRLTLLYHFHTLSGMTGIQTIKIGKNAMSVVAQNV